jgi:hypothetical protein
MAVGKKREAGSRRGGEHHRNGSLMIRPAVLFPSLVNVISLRTGGDWGKLSGKLLGPNYCTHLLMKKGHYFVEGTLFG